MASEQSDDSSPQIRALRQCSAELVIALSAADLVIIPWKLFASKLIEQDTTEYCQLPAVISIEKSSKIVCAVMKTVIASPHLFESLVSVLSESDNTALMSVGEELRQTYESELVTETHHPPTIPHQQLPAIYHYSEYLRAVYKRSELPEYSNPTCYKWIPFPGQKFKFINLAVISKNELTEKDVEGIKKKTIYGHIDMILKEKVPIALENILQVEQGQSLNCVLIEGAPGIGKSTLSWEICRRWGKGELFQEYSIVLLVTLRDERVQRATCVVDLFYHRDKNLLAEVVQEIDRTHGKGTLILLEGLGELPIHLLTKYSIFTSFLSGEIFPEATILVTSRPSATDKLWQRGWQKKSRHIEILGFTEDNIDEYTKNVLSDDQLLGFNNYLSIHPHIKSMMYVPLHCVIAMVVYLQCQRSDSPPPKTITGLYTCLAKTILLQYLQDHRDYKGKIHQFDIFSELPSPVYANFKRLCSLAFDGVSKQQLIFHNLSHDQSPDITQQFEHFGFMDAVPERFSLISSNHSYNFLHLSVQEYLAAYHVSLMNHSEQEQLLLKVRHDSHHFNMVQFLAGITQFKHLDKELVKTVIGISDIDEELVKRMPFREMGQECNMSEYTLTFLYEFQDVSILDGEFSYHTDIRPTDSVHCLTALGYCIAQSSLRWHVVFSERENSGTTEALCHNLKDNPHPTYSIESIEFRLCTTDFTHQLIQNLPDYALKQVKKISIKHNDALPPCLRIMVPRMERLNTLILEDVLYTPLTELILLFSVFTLRGLDLVLTSDEKSLKINVSDDNFCTGTIESINFTPEFLDQLLPALPQQTIAGTKLLAIYYELHHECKYQPLPMPPCLPGLILQMKRLSKLTLENVLDTSLTELISALSRVPTLENLLISNKTNASKFNHCTGTIESINCTQKFLNLLLPALPQQSIANIKSLIVNQKLGYGIDRAQPLPSCILELVPKMKNLNSLIFTTVLDATLIALMPVMPTVPITKNLTISITLNQFNSEKFICTNENICTCTCTAPEIIEQLLRFLPQQLIAQIQTFEVNYCTLKPAPPCLSELIPRMERLNTLTLKNVFQTSLTELIPVLSRVPILTLENIHDTSLTELIPVLPRVPTLRNLTLPKLNSQGIDLLFQWLPACQLETLMIILIESMKTKISHQLRMTFCNNSIETIDCQKCTKIFFDQILSQIPQQTLTYIKSLIIDYEEEKQPLPIPPCLPELISKMKMLKSLTLKRVTDTSLMELIPVLSRVPILRNLKTQSDSGNFEMLFPADSLSSTGTINASCIPKLVDMFLSQLPQQTIAHIGSLTVTWSQENPQPLPLSLPELIPRMERLNTLMLENVLDTSLTELIPVLSRVPTLRNLTLPKLNSDSIALLCQWLPTYQLETLTLIELKTRASHQLRMTFCDNSIETIDCQKCTKIFFDQILSQIPQQTLT